MAVQCAWLPSVHAATRLLLACGCGARAQVGKPKRREAVVAVPDILEERVQQLVGEQLRAAYRCAGGGACMEARPASMHGCTSMAVRHAAW